MFNVVIATYVTLETAFAGCLLRGEIFAGVYSYLLYITACMGGSQEIPTKKYELRTRIANRCFFDERGFAHDSGSNERGFARNMAFNERGFAHDLAFYERGFAHIFASNEWGFAL